MSDSVSRLPAVRDGPDRGGSSCAAAAVLGTALEAEVAAARAGAVQLLSVTRSELRSVEPQVNRAVRPNDSPGNR